MATLKDIAKLSGYSPSTVSRVLNNDGSFKISKEAEKKIIKTAIELGYKKKTKSKIKKSLSDVVVFVHDSGNYDVPNSFTNRMIEGLKAQAFHLNLKLDFIDSKTIPDKISKKNYLGAISIGTIAPKIIETLTYKNIPIIYIGESPNEKKYSSVQTDLHSITFEILEHFYQKGFRNTYLLVGKSTQVDENKQIIPKTNRRYMAYKNYLHDRGSFDQNKVFYGNYSMGDGYLIAKDIFSQNDIPDSLICGNDLMALGVLKAAHEFDLKIPDDIEMISYDNSEYAEIASTPLTSVDTPVETLGKQAVTMLIDEVTKYPSAIKVLIPTEIIFRKTSSR